MAKMSFNLKLAISMLVLTCITLLLYAVEVSVQADNSILSKGGNTWQEFLEVGPVAELLPSNDAKSGLKARAQEGAPNLNSFQNALSKCKLEMKLARQYKRNLIIYHVEDTVMNENSIDLALNNVKVFVTSIFHHSRNGSDQDAFYLFNMVGNNPAKQLIPTHLPNVAVVDWPLSFTPMYSFLQTVRLLGQDCSLFDAVFSLSSSTRGPLVHFQDGAWINDFRLLLDKNNAGLVGPTIELSRVPYVHTYAFALRSDILPKLKIQDFTSDLDQSQRQLTSVVMTAGFTIAELFQAKRDDSDNHDALLSACAIDPKDVIFLPWSGEHLGAESFHCGKGIAMNEKSLAVVHTYMSDITRTLLKSGKPLPAQLLPVLPEVASGGPYSDLYRQYSSEHLREQRAMAVLASKAAAERAKGSVLTPASAAAVLPEDSQVCFLVRTATMHDPTYVSPKTGKIRYVEMDLEVFAKCKCCFRVHLKIIEILMVALFNLMSVSLLIFLSQRC